MSDKYFVFRLLLSNSIMFRFSSSNNIPKFKETKWIIGVTGNWELTYNFNNEMNSKYSFSIIYSSTENLLTHLIKFYMLSI